jgi:hypothetical protein
MPPPAVLFEPDEARQERSAAVGGRERSTTADLFAADCCVCSVLDDARVALSATTTLIISR